MARKKSAAARSPATRTKRARQAEADAPVKEAGQRANATSKKSSRQRRPGSPTVKSQQARNKSFPIVGIGASAGGLEAFKRLLEHLPVDTGMAFVLVQHLDPTHQSILTELLARVTTMPVSEGQNDMVVEPDHVYVIPPNTNMAISRGALELLPRQEARGQHRPIDYFFRSLAEDQSHRAIGVVLSGTASDGTPGLEAIKAEGGITFAQDAKSATYDSMPRSAIASGCVDFILPPEKIAWELARIGRHPYVAPAEAPQPAEPSTQDRDGFNEILTLLRKAAGVDFTHYKSNTLNRRIARRMVLHKMESMEDYARYLSDDAAEVEALHQDLLIRVTRFFRDPEAFEVLTSKVFPKILNNKSPGESVRIWVVGCSTGEEAYSIAISALEYAGDLANYVPMQIFATDLNDASVQRARAGLYPQSIAHDVSPERLRRFFIEVEGGYQMSKPIRDGCVFARQNLFADPPFSRMDLISCRNLLIYLEPVLQKKIIPVLHYALKPTGFLFLGASETAGRFSDLFATEDKKHKIYSKRFVPTSMHFNLAPVDRGVEELDSGKKTGKVGEGVGSEHDAQKEADRIILAGYAPAGVLINADREILQFRGSTGSYIEPAPGKASLDLLKMAREGLPLALRAAIHQAKKTDSAVKKEGLQVKNNGQSRKVNLEVIPIKGPVGGERFFLVLFEEAAPAGGAEPDASRRGKAKASTARREADDENTRLRQELAATREYLQSAVEQHEAVNEELQAASEEAQSSNEELQSINEELETSKEEIESSNEELTTVNEELNNRNQELNQLNGDLINLLGSVNMPILMLGNNLRIRRFTQMAEKAWNLISTDVGRPVGDIKPNIDIPDLEQLIVEVTETGTAKELEVRDKQGRWYSMRVRPYRTLENTISGAVIVLVDIDEIKRSQAAIGESRDYSEAIVNTVREPLLILDGDLRVKTASRSFYSAFEVSPAETENQFIYELGDRQWDIPHLRPLLEEILHRNTVLEGFEVEHDFEHIGRRVMLLNCRQLYQDSSGTRSILMALEDVTDRRQTEREREELITREQAALREAEAANRAKDEFFATVSHELRTPLTAIVGWSTMLRTSKLDADISAKALETIERNARAQSQLIEDLMDVSRIIAGKLHLHVRPVELALVIKAVVESMRPAANAKSIRLETMLEAEAGRLSGDPQRLQQVLWNLLSNAIKFTPKCGRVSTRLERVGSEARITVSDTGQGISPEFLPFVFDRFRQADSTKTRRRGGLGLGLAIVRHLAELHGGTVQADSPGEGRGATFTLTLPLTPVRMRVRNLQRGGETISGQMPPGSSRALNGLRVLVVEDEADGREMLRFVLREYGAKVKVCAAAGAALKATERWRPDVLVCDIGMPGEDGYDLMRKVRALPAKRGGKVPAVALTGYASVEDRRRALAAGYQMHVPKPVQPAELVAAVASLVVLARESLKTVLAQAASSH